MEPLEDPAPAAVPSSDERSEAPRALRRIKVSHAFYPVIIGLGVVGYLFYKDFNPAIFGVIDFTWRSVFWLVVAVLLMGGRDFGYMWRIRVLSGSQLSWFQSFRVIMLWEFTSAVTPSAVGGTSVAILYVHKEGVSVGRSSAIVLLTSFLDEFYFIIMFPLLLLWVGGAELYDIVSLGENPLTWSLATIALTGYLLKLAYVVVLSYGLFLNPQGLKTLLVQLFKLRIFRKWAGAAERTGTDIVVSSQELHQKGVSFWLKAFGSTFLSWSSRYLVANALIMAFFGVSDQFLLFARQLVIWIMMLVMPTPGGSGFAEYIFTYLCGDLIVVTPALQLAAATLIAFLWRGVTYYPYLIMGAILFPRWLKRNFSLRKKN